MNEEEMTTFIENIRNKLGEENSALIGDDLGTIITNNANMLRERDKKDREINQLIKDKENLISANGNLLKQVSFEDKYVEKPKAEIEKPQDFSFKKMFDNKGNFIN